MMSPMSSERSPNRSKIVKPGTVAATVLSVIVALAVYIAQQQGWIRSGDSSPSPPASPERHPAAQSPSAEADGLLKSFHSKQSQVIVTGSGRVVHLLPDDTDTSDGSGAHQKFLVEVTRELTIRLVNNIDPGFSRVPVRVGDFVRFKGEYVYNDKGGTVHCTHHDPARRHADGWVELNGKKFD